MRRTVTMRMGHRCGSFFSKAAVIVVAVFVCQMYTISGAIAATTTPPQLSCSASGSTCRVAFEVDDGSIHTAELIRESTSVFGSDATVVIEGEASLINDRKLEGIRYHTRLSEGHWATARISEDGKVLMDGIFVTEKHGIIEWSRDEVTSTHTRRLSLIEKSDIAIELPGDKPWLQYRDPQYSDFNASNYGPGEVIPFFPDCYPQDAVTHVLKLNLIYDVGLFESLTARYTGTDAQKQSKVLADLEGVFSPGKLLYLSQLNVQLEINKVVFSKSTDPVPLSRSASTGTCLGATKTMGEFMKWLSTNNPVDPTGYWVFMSDCFSTGLNGASYIGNVCGSTNNGGVAAYSWSVIFHELGHGLGMTHSFENGVGMTGGLMDYGDTLYNGVTQFHPLKRPEVCTYLTYLKTDSCRYFYPVVAGSSCGDGVLTRDEECECLTRGSKDCGKCVKCKLTDPAIECSVADFVVRNFLSPDIVVVENAAMPSKECCLKDKFAPPKTLCGPGLLDACGGAGECTSLCTKQFLSTTPNCGFDDSGCLLGCFWRNRCQFDSVYTLNGADALVSALPDGTVCQSQGVRGKCHNSTCIIGAVDEIPADMGSLSPTLRQSTRQPTALQTNSPARTPTVATKEPTVKRTKSPTKAPTKTPTKLKTEDPGAQLDPDARCAKFKKKKKCAKVGGCKWCGPSAGCLGTCNSAI